MGFSRQEYWSGVPLPSPPRVIGDYKLRRDRRIKRESFLKEIEELRQVYSLQLIQVTERKVLL